jgi:hypothetical protein
LASGSAGAATTDDVKWVNQYAQDNKGGVADEVVLKYCTCMNNKMSDSETQRAVARMSEATSGTFFFSPAHSHISLRSCGLQIIDFASL